MNIKFSILALTLMCSNTSWSTIEMTTEKGNISSQSNSWFNRLRNQVLVSYPMQGSQAAEWDRQASNKYTAISGERSTLAKADQNQSSDYIYHEFVIAALGEREKTIDLCSIAAYQQINNLYKTAIYTYDKKARETRSFDFILKDDFKRGRPHQVLDEDGSYIKNYISVVGSSFPSGHSWAGFKQAIGLSLIFPERGSEVFSRALQYAESRVIVGAHFPTDTIASRMGSYFSLAQLLADDGIATTLVSFAQEVRKEIANACHESVNSCIATQSASPIYSNNSIGYYGKQDATESPRITPDEIPDKAGYLLRLRIPIFDRCQLA